MSLTPRQLLYVRALRIVAGRVEVSIDPDGYCETNGEPKELADAIRQVISNLRRQASKLEGKK